MLYVVLGTVKEVSIGPTSLMALFTLQICRGLPVEFVVLLTFLSGCVVLIMGLLRLGNVLHTHSTLHHPDSFKSVFSFHAPISDTLIAPIHAAQ